MSVEKVNRSAGPVWRVRWREGGRNRARTFDLRRDALRYETEVRRRAQLEASPNSTRAPRRSTAT